VEVARDHDRRLVDGWSRRAGREVNAEEAS
jgi:hypothetical protein